MFFRSGGLNNREQSVGSNATSMTSTTLMTVSGDLSGIWYGFWLFYQLCYTNSSTACNKKYFIITWLQSVCHWLFTRQKHDLGEISSTQKIFLLQWNEKSNIHALISFYIVWRKKSRKEYTDKTLKDEI